MLDLMESMTVETAKFIAVVKLDSRRGPKFEFWKSLIILSESGSRLSVRPDDVIAIA